MTRLFGKWNLTTIIADSFYFYYFDSSLLGTPNISFFNIYYEQALSSEISSILVSTFCIFSKPQRIQWLPPLHLLLFDYNFLNHKELTKLLCTDLLFSADFLCLRKAIPQFNYAIMPKNQLLIRKKNKKELRRKPSAQSPHGKLF